MKSTIVTGFLITLILLSFSTNAQKNQSPNGHNVTTEYTYGINEQRDSIAYARFRCHMDSIRTHRPTVALVLSGGGAKGAAHIPVIQYLEEVGIPIDLVMGTSIGGLVGGLYSCGYDGKQLEEIICSQDWDYLMRDTHPRKFNTLTQKDYDKSHQIKIPFGEYRWDMPKLSKIDTRSILRDGIITGRNVEDLFASLLPGYTEECDFLKLPIPFVCIASDMISAKAKVWHSGSLIEALRSTMSIPGLFTPVRTNGMVLMDGFMRNNFPADIARELGADIIIGVDISTPALKEEQMRSFIDVVFQAADVMARETFEAGVANSDIYIQPELSDFNMLSFDSNSINIILQRGRDAAKKHSDDIKKLKQKYFSDFNPKTAKKKNTVDISKEKVSISEVSFVGIDSSEENYLIKLLDLPHFISKKELDNAIATLMGTKAFEKVTYELLGEKAPYKLRFNFFRSPINTFGAGFRFDTKDYAALMLSLGFNTCRLTGSRWDISARLGMNNKLKLAYTYRSGKATDLGTDISFQAVRNGDFSINPNYYHIDFNRGMANLFLSLSPTKRTSMKIGMQSNYYYRINLLSDNVISRTSADSITQDNFYLGAYIKMRSDSYDDPYFPTSGIQYNLDYDCQLINLLNDSPTIHSVQFAIRPALSLGILTFTPYIEGRWVSENIYPYSNMLSVGNANSILEHEILFIGITTSSMMLQTLGTAGLNMRLRIGKSHYLTASVQALHESENINDFIDADMSNTYCGMAFEYAYNTLAGPIRAKVHWSDLTNSVGFYLSMGFDF